MNAPTHGMKISTTAHPALAHPLSVWSPNMSKTQRNHTVNAAIQMKIQKLHRRTSPKSLVMESMSGVSRLDLGRAPRSQGAESGSPFASARGPLWQASRWAHPTPDGVETAPYVERRAGRGVLGESPRRGDSSAGWLRHR